MTVEEHVTDLLQRCACHSLSLQQLHTRLVREVGGSAGTYHELHTRLKLRSTQFSVVCRPDPLGAGPQWTGGVREAYAEALRRAGVDTSPVVTLLANHHDRSDVMAAMRATLMEISAQLNEDPVAREDLLLALTALSG